MKWWYVSQETTILYDNNFVFRETSFIYNVVKKNPEFKQRFLLWLDIKVTMEISKGSLEEG